MAQSAVFRGSINIILLLLLFSGISVRGPSNDIQARKEIHNFTIMFRSNLCMTSQWAARAFDDVAKTLSCDFIVILKIRQHVVHMSYITPTSTDDYLTNIIYEQVMEINWARKIWYNMSVMCILIENSQYVYDPNISRKIRVHRVSLSRYLASMRAHISFS